MPRAPLAPLFAYPPPPAPYPGQILMVTLTSQPGVGYGLKMRWVVVELAAALLAFLYCAAMSTCRPLYISTSLAAVCLLPQQS